MKNVSKSSIGIFSHYFNECFLENITYEEMLQRLTDALNGYIYALVKMRSIN